MVELIKHWKLSDQESATWFNAAAQFRLPYWDWGQKQPYLHDYGIPEICTKPNWDIIAPGGDGKQKESFPNPLIGFTNPKTDKSGKNVPMGDPSMGPNAIKDDLNPILQPVTSLPVSDLTQNRCEANRGSGVGVLVQADTEYVQTNQNHNGPRA